MNTRFYQRLYWRIWLAVVASVVVLALVAGWLSRMEFERERAERERERAERPGREIILRDASGDVVGRAPVRPNRVPGQGLEFEVPLKTGGTLIVQLPRPNRPPGMGPPDGGPMGPGGMRPREPSPTRLPFPLPWMLVLVAAAVALATYPIVRRLTKRLETVQQGVERWGAGDLSTRLSEQGQDEVAFLATRFNHAARQIETLLTDQKKLLDAQAVLLQSQKSLLANASHELRSPLARLRMGLELGAAAPNSASKAEMARNIAELDQLIEEILLASRLDAKEADMGTVEAVDLIGLAAEECARVGANLEVHCGPVPVAAAQGESASAPPESARAAPDELVVQGVAKLLRRALRNLLENARRHGDGDIQVNLSRQQGLAVITVRDQGPGVPLLLRERIFEAFYRLPGASEHAGGMGLGLALVKSIAQRHGGSVVCDQAPADGACFVLSLPLGRSLQTY